VLLDAEFVRSRPVEQGRSAARAKLSRIPGLILSQPGDELGVRQLLSCA